MWSAASMAGYRTVCPRRRNVTTSMVGFLFFFKWSHTQKISQKVVNPIDTAGNALEELWEDIELSVWSGI